MVKSGLTPLQRRQEALFQEMRAYLKRETDLLTREYERLKKAYEDAGRTFPDGE